MSHLTAHAKRVCCWAHVNYYKTIRTMTIRWASDKKKGKSLHILRLQDEKSTNKEHSRYLSVTSHMWVQQFKSAINWASFHISFHISYSPLLSETSLREKKGNIHDEDMRNILFKMFTSTCFVFVKYKYNSLP